MLNILRIPAGLPDDESDPLQAELARRLVATVQLLDRLFLPFLDIERPSMHNKPLPQLLNDDDFDALRTRRRHAPAGASGPNLMQEVLVLSNIYSEACRVSKTQEYPQDERWASVISSLMTWQELLPFELQDTDANFETHRARLRLRLYVFVHILHRHTWQLTLLDNLEWTTEVLTGHVSLLPPQVLSLYEHAAWVADMTCRLWEVARLDLHNSCFGLIVIITQTILVHRLLSSSDFEEKSATQSKMRGLRDCMIRVKDHCRLFNWVVGFLPQTSYSRFPRGTTAYLLFNCFISFTKLNGCSESAGKTGSGRTIRGLPCSPTNSGCWAPDSKDLIYRLGVSQISSLRMELMLQATPLETSRS